MEKGTPSDADGLAEKEVIQNRPTPDAVEQRLRPGLNTFSVCATAVTLPGVWGFAAATLVTGIIGGGPCVEIWGTLAMGLSFSVFCSCLAEYSSAFPSAAGCTHIASQVASPEWGPLLSYLTGSIHAWGVLFTPPALMLAAVNLLFTCVCVMKPDYNPHRWHIFLAYQGLNLAYYVSLKYGTNVLSVLMDVGVITLFLSLFVTMGVILGLSSGTTRPSSESIWKTFQNNTGLSSSTIGALLGLSGPIYAFGPPHWLLNMAEDVQNPSRNIPIGLLAQQIGNTVTLFVFYIALYYSVSDFAPILTSHYPSIVGAVYQQAVSRAGIVLVLLLLLLVPSRLGIFGYTSANIRLLYGFARNGSFTHAKWWSKIDSKHNIPINVLNVITIANFVLGFIYLASETGFTIILGSAEALYFLGYMPMLIACLITKRRYLRLNSTRQNPDHKPYYSLSRPLGLACDAFSLFLQLLILTIFCLPTAGPVTVQNFNWTPLILIIILAITALGWASHGRHQYSVEILQSLSRHPSAVDSPTLDADKPASGTVI